MKIQNKSLKTALLLGVAAWTLTSCQDWLTLYPQTQVVEENFWEDKNDLEGVRYAAYTQMCSTLDKIVNWGDLRSDSYELNSGFNASGDQAAQNTHDLYREIREGRIERDSANTYFDWSGFYTTINYCNKVLFHGPEVLERDKQFTTSEWLQIKAEITALRALNYFYLIRSFKDVPYTTKVINKDTEIEYFGATNQLVVLDSLIADVENVKGKARNRFSRKVDSKGLITNAAIYALLSDMYLWRASLHEGRGITEDTVAINNIPEQMGTTVNHTVEGDYRLCIKYADEAMAALAEQTANSRLGEGVGVARSETLNYGLANCDMYKNDFRGFSTGTMPALTAFNQIFVNGNSDESIFELQFNTSDNRKNEIVNSLWHYQTKTHFSVSRPAMDAIASGDEQTRDSRMWFSAWSNLVDNSSGVPGIYCFKWGDVTLNLPENHQTSDIALDIASSTYCNWIIYRLSDVMLQKAEALAALKDKEALRYVNAIHRRWYCNDDRNSTAQPSESVMGAEGIAYRDANKETTLGNISKPKTEDLEIAVLNERQIEFLGEGKRWFDLVRYAERHAGGQDGTRDPREWTEELPIGNGKAGVDLMAKNFLANTFDANPKWETLLTRFKNRYGLYNLIYYKEIKGSAGKLEQNPVWNKHTYEE